VQQILEREFLKNNGFEIGPALAFSRLARIDINELKRLFGSE
jgi:hypothetical protein